MNRELVNKVANTILYEGYMLYPYRTSAVKNRQRWSFGILYPPAYQEVVQGTERSVMHSECLLQAKGEVVVQVELRFLHLLARQLEREGEVCDKALALSLSDDRLLESWDEGVERSVTMALNTSQNARQLSFDCPGSVKTEPPQNADERLSAVMRQTQHGLTGTIAVSANNITEHLLKLTIDISNTTGLPGDPRDRDQALLRSMLSAHTILTATGGEFVSLLDYPAELTEVVNSCHNPGNFPVLVGNKGERDMMLCSPILLYDYPQIAPESGGDFYDATEMDEMLTLRIMTLTDEEKVRMRLGDDHLRELLQRTEHTAREQLTKTHGVIRSLRPVSETHE